MIGLLRRRRARRREPQVLHQETVMALSGTCRSLHRCVNRLAALAEDAGVGDEAEAIIADARSSLGEFTAYEPGVPR